tara:strand:- start:470 stop:571 length:102 start_codon:yes stop_codon:yes gene_type:complete
MKVWKKLMYIIVIIIGIIALGGLDILEIFGINV